MVKNLVLDFVLVAPAIILLENYIQQLFQLYGECKDLNRNFIGCVERENSVDKHWTIYKVDAHHSTVVVKGIAENAFGESNTEEYLEISLLSLDVLFNGFVTCACTSK